MGPSRRGSEKIIPISMLYIDEKKCRVCATNQENWTSIIEYQNENFVAVENKVCTDSAPFSKEHTFEILSHSQLYYPYYKTRNPLLRYVH